jgi:drug/metabolite transporter (DMT)-like permease
VTSAPSPLAEAASHAAGIAGVAAVVASAAAFGAMAIFVRIAYASGVDTTTLLALRFALAAAAMLAIALLRGIPLPTGATLGALVLLGALGYGGQAYSFFTALTLAPAGLVALLLYLHPALVALLAAALLHERLTPLKLGALAVALAGTTLTIAPALGIDPDATTMAGLGKGIAFALAAAAFYSAYIIAGAWIGREVPAFAMSTIVIASAGAVFVSAAFVRSPRWPHGAEGWLAVVAIALLSTVAAITLYFAGLARIGPTRASTLSTLEPLVTVSLAAVVLGETIAPVQMVGGALILAAVVLLARTPAA